MEIVRKRQKYVTTTYVEKTVCDKCNQDVLTDTDCYDAFEFYIEMKFGQDYPGGGSGERYEFDLCKKCTVEFIELMKSNGIRVQKTEWDT